HIRVAQKCTASDGSGFATNAFTPTSVIKGTTRNANNTGFYRYFCVGKNATNDSVVSNIAEVAVGCGAKNLQGEWLSFMCFNLGATELTIAAQKNHTLAAPTNEADGLHTYQAGEEAIYGDLYQWGRIRDGHEQRGAGAGFVAGSNAAGTNQAAYSAATPIVFEDGNIIGTSQTYPWRQVSRADNNYYGKFITTTRAQNYNWAYDLPDVEKDQLWRTGRFAPNDPCAKIKEDGLTYETFYPETNGIASANTAWRIPAQDEWSNIYKGGTISDSPDNALANTWTWYNSNGRGFDIKPDGVTTTLHLPANGFRNLNGGCLYRQGSNGYYWGSTFSATHTYTFYFSSGNVNPAVIGYRGYGYALRCIRSS
ncbi:MAG: fibrobacter succinogenes major paralogous domain-containing protein, partial [Prevotellaceae bacterium]|nr:fibrobacter succinogenes major paralogous domain-containing protein [Prevotellaceae bacterium]